jgi:hypothetical protein
MEEWVEAAALRLFEKWDRHARGMGILLFLAKSASQSHFSNSLGAA